MRGRRVALVLTALLWSSTAGADPVVFSGHTTSHLSLFFDRTWAGWNLYLGNDHDVFGGNRGTTPASGLFACSPCNPGDSINLRTVLTGDAFGTGPGRVRGVFYDRLYFSGILTYDGPTVPARPGVWIAGRFSFGGHVDVFTDPARVPFSAGHLVSADVSGGGTTHVGFAGATTGTGALRWEGVTYEGAPIPEPGTMLLLGAGLAGAVIRRARR